MEQKNKLDQACMMQFIENLDSAAVLDETGTYIYVSPSWQRFTGHTAQDALGRKVWELLPDTHAPEVLRTGKPVLAQVVRAQGVPAAGRQRQGYRRFYLCDRLRKTECG